MTAPSAPPAPSAPSPDDLAPILGDLSITAEDLGSAAEGGGWFPVEHLLAAAGPHPDAPGPAGAAALVPAADEGLSPSGTLLLYLDGVERARDLAAWRNALWPLLHVVAHYHLDGQRVRRHTLGGEQTVGTSPLRGSLLVGQRRSRVLSPAATVDKFDRNATGWDGRPGSPGYPHFRWMRRHVALFAPPVGPGGSILEFGCGAGWCGIEAARRARSVTGAAGAPGPRLCAFDPSPEMVRIATANARGAGLDGFEARVGFGEDPPFPADGEEPFDLVISSGVVSFAPDREAWLDGIARTVRPGGRLVIGDINRDSRGFRRRRRRKPLLPARELNATTRGVVRAGLERRGFVHEKWAAYQLTWPVPEAMHLSETRLGGLLSRPFLWANRLGAALDGMAGSVLDDRFDSWVIALTRPA